MIKKEVTAFLIKRNSFREEHHSEFKYRCGANKEISFMENLL